MLAILVGATAGCASSAEVAAQATAARLACEQSYHCGVVVPRCGPAVTTVQGFGGRWYKGMQVPGNVEALVGFRPLLPTWIPGASSLYAVTVAGADTPTGQPVRGQALRLHVGYGAWPPQTEPPAGRVDQSSVLSLDEVASPLDPLADLTGGGQQMLRIVGQREVEVAGGPATTYRLAWAGAAEGTVQAVELLWRAGPATLRLLVVRDALDRGATLNAIFIFAPAGSPPAADNLDFVKADLRLSRTNDPSELEALLLQVAASAAPLGDCARQA